MTARAASTSATSRTFGVLLACLLLLLGLGLGLLLLAPEGYRHGTPHAHLIHQSLLGGAHGSGSHREQHQRELRRQHVCVAEDPLPNVPQRTSLFPFTWASAKGKAGAQALGTAGSKEQARDSSSNSGSMAALRDQYSIWAQARGRTGEQLRSEIAHLAARHPPAPVFLPHVTVLGDIDGPREEVVRVARELAQQVKKYRVNFTGVTRGSLYYQCVYLGVANDQPVMEAAAAARRAYGMTTGPYMPHLSLLYSDMDESERAKVVEYETGRLYGEGSGYDTLLADSGFEVSHFSVWYTPVADRSCESWCLVEEVELP